MLYSLLRVTFSIIEFVFVSIYLLVGKPQQNKIEVSNMLQMSNRTWDIKMLIE